MRFNVFFLLCCLSLAGCAPTKVEIDLEKDTLHKIYNTALALGKEGKNLHAAETFEKIEQKYPLSKWAIKAKLMAAYFYYEAQKHEESLAQLEDFIALNPRHPNVDYALYLIGLNYFHQLSGVNRDQAMTHDALKAFQMLVTRFPKTRYAKDARLKIDLCNEHLAGHSMEVGRFYLNTNMTAAALDRFDMVVKKYQTTSHTAEALHRMVECFLILNLPHEAKRVGAVLGHNYPGSKWYQFTYDLLQDKLNFKSKAPTVPAASE